MPDSTVTPKGGSLDLVLVLLPITLVCVHDPLDGSILPLYKTTNMFNICSMNLFHICIVVVSCIFLGVQS